VIYPPQYVSLILAMAVTCYESRVIPTEYDGDYQDGQGEGI
jgi:hypothetical protein